MLLSKTKGIDIRDVVENWSENSDSLKRLSFFKSLIKSGLLFLITQLDISFPILLLLPIHSLFTPFAAFNMSSSFSSL